MWTDGRIPYVICDVLAGEKAARIPEAIREWKSKAVMDLRARIDGPDYLRFGPVTWGQCRVDLGMSGGEQQVCVPPSGWTVSTYVHEVGHAVGLWHEHERDNRDEFVAVSRECLDPLQAGSCLWVRPADGPYDYASTMHQGWARSARASSPLRYPGRLGTLRKR